MPLALLAFSVINCVLGVRASHVTGALRPPSRRNVGLAIGLAGGLAFFGAAVFASHPGRDWVVVSGVAAAWLPLAVPLLEAVALAAVTRHQDYLPVFPWFSGRPAFPSRGI